MKAFFSTLALTLCAALLAGGLLWADVQTRAVTFDDSTPPYARLKNTSAALPLPATGEALRHVYHGEKALLSYLREKYENIT